MVRVHTNSCQTIHSREPSSIASEIAAGLSDSILALTADLIVGSKQVEILSANHGQEAMMVDLARFQFH